MPPERRKKYLPKKIVAEYTLVVLAIIVTSIFIWVIKDALLAAFAGIILASVIVGTAQGLRKFLPISRGWSLITVGLILILLIGSFVMIFGSQISREFDQLVDQLPEKVEGLQETIRGWPGGDQIMDNVSGENGEEANGENSEEAEDFEPQPQNNAEAEQEDEDTNDLPAETGSYILRGGATLVDILATIGIVFIVGIYFAINPEIYKQGFLLLVTKKKEERINETLDATGRALWLWLKGQLIAMAFVGISITIGLLIIGVPLALVLGLIAGLLEFIPYIGPFAAAIPILLLAFSVDTQTVFFTAILLLIVQQLESNVVTPIVQHQMVYIPPSIVVLSVVAFGLVFGIAGLILATPLAVVAMVLVGMLYVQDVLGKDIKVPGQIDDSKKDEE